ncbi:helix-turn-helix domain-containing protein [Nocardia sp. NPDC004568]|uniref:helix-turn-helix domain-containing protein n=1 Tax=Nocardia sp. NPDC004568 TaxID=3154551 RepID=UPI0033BC8646
MCRPGGEGGHAASLSGVANVATFACTVAVREAVRFNGCGCVGDRGSTRGVPMRSKPIPSSRSAAPSHRDQPGLSDPPASVVNDETWLSTRDVAQRLKIPVKTLSSWAAAGRGPRFARIGRYRRYRLADLLAWEQERLAEGGGGSSLG